VSRLATALTAAGAFLAGVLLVAVLGGAKSVVHEKTVTVPGIVTNGGTVITRTPVPALVGERLDTARERLARSRFDYDTEGGGILGVIVAENWEVTAQDPAPGEELEQGSTVHLRISRR
jgi:hypothetical protein